MSLPTPPPDTGGSKEEPIDAPIYLIPLSESALSSSQLQTNNKKRLASTAIPPYVSDLQDQVKFLLCNLSMICTHSSTSRSLVLSPIPFSERQVGASKKVTSSGNRRPRKRTMI